MKHVFDKQSLKIFVSKVPDLENPIMVLLTHISRNTWMNSVTGLTEGFGNLNFLFGCLTRAYLMRQLKAENS